MTRILLLLLLIANSIFANSPLGNEIDRLLSEIPASSNIGVIIYNPNTRDTIYSLNSRKTLIPASNTKLFTTAVALELMGNNYRLSTAITSQDTDFSDGIIDGDLYIKGFGNPTLSAEDIDTLAQKLKEMGIKKITGNIVGDDSYFDDIYTRDDWIVGEHANVHLSPVSALAINRNRVLLTLYSNKGYGKEPGYSVIPDYPFVSVSNTAVISKGRRNPKIRYSFDNNKFSLKISGKTRKRSYGFTYSFDANNPPLFAALALRDALRKEGIEIEGKATTGIAPEAMAAIVEKCITVGNLISLVNKNSDNYLAESLFKSLGAYYSGEQGNSFYATQAVLSFINEHDIFVDGTSIVDGSGISRYNKITVNSICGLLETVYFDDKIFNTFYNSLAIGGVDGTLKDRLRRAPAYNNFHGKTGTLNGVTSLSGYLITKSGEELIISMIMEFKKRGANYYRNIQDKIVEAVAEGL